jgi:hypothetical protein
MDLLQFIKEHHVLNCAYLHSGNCHNRVSKKSPNHIKISLNTINSMRKTCRKLNEHYVIMRFLRTVWLVENYANLGMMDMVANEHQTNLAFTKATIMF